MAAEETCFKFAKNPGYWTHCTSCIPVIMVMPTVSSLSKYGLARNTWNGCIIMLTWFFSECDLVICLWALT